MVGTREVVGTAVAGAEPYEFWTQSLCTLKSQGLSGVALGHLRCAHGSSVSARVSGALAQGGNGPGVVDAPRRRERHRSAGAAGDRRTKDGLRANGTRGDVGLVKHGDH